MDTRDSRTSLLWQYCDRLRIGARRHDLRRFRSHGANHKLALFNPARNGVRYLRTLIYHLASSLSEAGWQRLRNTSNRNLIGEPITVTCNGEAVCLDYLQAVLELEFIAAHLTADKPATVIEIGAGYGRTSHVLACNCDLAAYWIVDLPGCLSLSQQYLGLVLPPDIFGRFHFVPASELPRIRDLQFDLAINIDSFAEMGRDTVRCYLDCIERQCRLLYVKNPVCNNLERPADPTLGTIGRLRRFLYNLLARRLTSGFVLADEIDIFNGALVREQASAFVDAYRPTNAWRCLGHAPAPPWVHYWQALYRKNDIRDEPIRQG